jgi:hypothetical protein
MPLLLVLCGLAIAASAPPPAQAAGPASARAYLERQQNPDGGYGATPSASSNLDMTAWAMLGMEASGRNPLDLKRNGRSPVDFLRTHPATSTADLEKVILALEGAGLNSRSFEGRDLVAALRSKRNSNGSWGGFVDFTAFGVFAMKAAGAPASELRRSTAWLRSAQNNDGGWGYEPGSFSTPDSTGSALQALATTGAGSAGGRGVSYLRRAQGSDGSFGANSQGTAWAVQGLVAAGANPASFSAGGNTAFDFLAARQVRDGHYRYSASSDQTPIWVTSQALMAFEREAFPVEPVPRTTQPGGLPPPVAPSGSDRGSGGAVGSAEGGAAKGPKGSNGAKKASGKKGEKKRRGEGPAAGGEQAAEAALASAEAAPGAEAGEGAGEDATPYLLGGLAALALALGGGFLWYRRRLP